MADFEPCFKKVIGIEGGFNLHTVKGDTGGMTLPVLHVKMAGMGRLGQDRCR